MRKGQIIQMGLRMLASKTSIKVKKLFMVKNQSCSQCHAISHMELVMIKTINIKQCETAAKEEKSRFKDVVLR